MISAKVIQDSISQRGHRLTTMEVKFHRFILGEFNTHRVLSRNSASSRAIPVRKQIDWILDDPAIPIQFGTNQPGMQAGDPLEGDALNEAIAVWLEGRDAAVETAQKLDALGVHKQVTNRVLEPYMWHTVICSATEWEGFWEQRVSPLAQPEIETAAREMLIAWEQSSPRLVGDGGWHTPYVTAEEYDTLTFAERLKVSVARCARVSYLSHSGKPDIEADLKLYRRLRDANPPHWSPFEHVATPRVLDGVGQGGLGNFTGWHQLRHIPEVVDETEY